MLDRFEFLVSEALVALRRNWLMTFAAITTSAVALFLLGGLGYVYSRVNAYAEDVSDKFEMRVWLRDGLKVDQVQLVAKQLRAIPGVKEARWVPREVEWQKMKKDMPDVTLGVENPLPHSFKVVLARLTSADNVAASIRALPLVEKDGVAYMKVEQRMMDDWLRLMRWLGGGLGSLLLITAGILIYNAIRMTILARRREIRIMELVGASRFTVRTPFVIEGIFQGWTGGVLAAVLIWSAQAAIETKMKELTMVTNLPQFPIWLAIILLSLAGGIFGGLCSILALREPVRLRPGH